MREHIYFHGGGTNNRQTENAKVEASLNLRLAESGAKNDNYGPQQNGVVYLTYFKLIICCFFSIISPHFKFHPNRTKNTEVKNLHFWLILVGQAGSSRNGGRHLKLILSCFYPIISPHTKFHPNRTKSRNRMSVAMGLGAYEVRGIRG